VTAWAAGHGGGPTRCSGERDVCLDAARAGRGAGLGRRDLIDAAVGVGQRHDRQVAHPELVHLEAVRQRASAGHPDLPLADQQAQLRILNVAIPGERTAASPAQPA